MPRVAGKRYPYTTAGKTAARKASKALKRKKGSRPRKAARRRGY
jgi:hypothetical protein